MAKFHKKISQERQTTKSPAAKSTKASVKKQRKKKDKVSSNGVYKNNLKKPNASNEFAKNTCTNVQKSKKKKQYDLKNKLDAKGTERSDVPIRYREVNKKNSQMFQKVQINANSKTKQKRKNKNIFGARRSDVSKKYSKDNKETSEMFKKEQVNTTNKTEHKKRNTKQKRDDMNLDHINHAVTINERKVRNKKLQVAAKNLDLEHRKTKVEKLKRINEKKMKRLSTEIKEQQVTSDKLLKLNKHKIKIKQLEETFTSKSQLKPKVTQLTLRDRMMAQLRASRFRFINEILYTNDSSQSKHYFKTDPDSFVAYHAGYKMQLEQWAVNPLDVIISSIKKLPTDNVIADFGCGEARLAASVPHVVHSFDFIALNDRVKACDMAHTPLLTNSVHVVVFCLSLMGSNLSDYIIEANRVLKNNGILKIVEVESRFEDIKKFIRLLYSYGFKNTWKDLSHKLFYFMDFRKEEDINMRRKNLLSITLKSCLYKKR